MFVIHALSFWFTTRNSFKKIIGALKFVEVSWSSLEWSECQSKAAWESHWNAVCNPHHGWGCTRQVSSHINSPISVDWPLQKEGSGDNQAEILRNLSQCPCPLLEGMQKSQKWSIDASALYLGNRQSPHGYSTEKKAKDDVKEQLLSLGF